MDLEVLKLKKKSKKSRADIVAAVLCKLQGALTRYHLRKRARGVFSLRCSRAEFFALLGGYADIKQHSSGRMHSSITGENKGDILDKLAAIFNTNGSHWFARRYYGADHKVERDCSYLKFDLSHSKRSAMLFSWKLHKVAQVTRAGAKKITSLGKLVCKLPRGVAPVKPARRYRATRPKPSVSAGVSAGGPLR
jgi:hypothetical protein